jgi:hypothetical protein
MADDFNIITEQDKTHVAYGLCVLGQMAVGATFGSIAGGQTLLGAAGGTVWGLFTCKYLAEPIKSKLFSQRGRLSDNEFKQVLAAAKRQFPLATKAQLLGLIVQARGESARSPGKYQC